MSKRRVYLSPLAEQKLDDILDYLEKEWSEKTDQISSQPKSCPESKRHPGIFKGVVEKHTSFYYWIVNNEIEIITVIDNRQNPVMIDKEIENLTR